MPHIGMIGLGLLGGALAERFIRNHFRVSGFDLDEKARARFGLCGGHPTARCTDVFATTNVIVLCLPDSGVVARVLQGVEPLLPGKKLVDTTTGDPDATAELSQWLARRGATYVDATIAGSSQQVRDVEAIVLAGGDVDHAVRCEPLFSCFARAWYHVGPAGSGARMKLVVNLVLGLNRAVLAEGLVFAKSLGLDLTATLKILQSGPTYSQVMDTKGRKMIDGDFDPVARLNQHLKDVRLIREAARRKGLQLPLSDLHEKLLVEAATLGYGESDNSAIIRAVEAEASRERQRPEHSAEHSP